MWVRIFLLEAARFKPGNVLRYTFLICLTLRLPTSILQVAYSAHMLALKALNPINSARNAVSWCACKFYDM